MPLYPNDLDRRIWAEELEDFVPSRIFDAHLHCLYRDCCLSKEGDEPPEYKTTEHLNLDKYDRADIDDTFAKLFPGREVHYLLFGWVFRRNDFDGNNAFTAAQVADDPLSAALMQIHPSFSVDKVEADLDKYGFHGFKPYRLWADDEVNCRVTDMMPEPLIELANDRHLIIMMHIGKSEGIADEQNITDLLHLAEKYPDVRWDLAHMARASIAWPLERAIDRIKEVPNFWYDFSSAAYSDVFTVAFRNIALDRIMFGTDFPCDLIKGNMLSFGYGWDLVTEEHLAAMNITHCDPRATYSHYETLRAFKRAAGFEGYGRPQIEDIFFNNAMKFVHPGTSP